MIEPVWVSPDVVLAIHERLLADHGGAVGLRGAAMLESVLAIPHRLFSHGEPDLAESAAAYVAAVVRNHPFLDGNKRTAFLTAYIFLTRNGLNLTAGEVDATHAALALAGGEVSVGHFAQWLRDNTIPRSDRS